jgi:hypothetical protein
MKRLLCLLAGAAILSCACASTTDAPSDRAGVGTSKETPAPPDNSKPKGGHTPRPDGPVEDPAPEFAFETFEGGTFRLSEQRGTPVVLNFWESW